MAGNKGLRSADKAKQDEFYTNLQDIENEIKHYRKDFEGKTVLCNCDDPYESNFFKYFAVNFNFLKLKKLIATCYDGSVVAGTQLTIFDDFDESDRKAYKVEITEIKDLNNDGCIDLFDVELLLKQPGVVQRLEGNGDFRSNECIELLKESDIVVTNPPFSLFREYVTQLIEFDKKFIIIGNTNSLTYKEIFSLFKENKIRTGYTNFNVGMFFVVPDTYEKYHHIDEKGRKIARVSTSCWFTNLDVKKHHEELVLFKKYIPADYPKYDNYDAINIDTYKDIPCDYYGEMGVPITFLDKYNPMQFEIIDGIGRYSILSNEETKKAGKYLSMINGKALYFRVIIRRK